VGEECAEKTDLYADGWRSYRMDEPFTDDLPALAFFCPDYAVREFGWR
jgi:hypothetical protein